MFLWLWPRLGATAPIGPLACEPPHAMGAALEKTKKKKKKERIVVNQDQARQKIIKGTKVNEKN